MKKNLTLALAFTALLPACGRKNPPPVVLRPPAVAQPDASAPENKAEPIAPVIPTPPTAEAEKAPEVPEPDSVSEATVPSSFLVGEQKFDGEEYPDAALSFEEFLKRYPNHEKSEEASFRLALAYALSGDTEQLRKRARKQLSDFVSRYPQSRYRAQAEYLLKLQAEIERLRADAAEKDKRLQRLGEELERLKQIDLNRRPSRPPL